MVVHLVGHCATSQKVTGLIPNWGGGGSERFFIDLIHPTALWPWD